MDLTLSKVAFTGKPHKGVLLVPLEEVTGIKKHKGVMLSLVLVAKCDGDFGQDPSTIDIDPDEDCH